MQHADLITIANAANALRILQDLNKQFLAHAQANPSPADVPTALQVGENSISIECFGHLATAAPRAVRAAGDAFLMEYVLSAPFGDERVEVTRFYLSQNGQLLESPSAQRSICDFNNSYVAKHLCGRALLGALASALMQPRKS